MDLDLFLFTLPYMAIGMAEIFGVTLVIVLCIKLLQFFTRERKTTKSSEEK